jgi:hypothetical protein
MSTPTESERGYRRIYRRLFRAVRGREPDRAEVRVICDFAKTCTDFNRLFSRNTVGRATKAERARMRRLLHKSQRQLFWLGLAR